MSTSTPLHHDKQALPSWAHVFVIAIVICTGLIPAFAMVYRNISNAAFAILLLVGLIAISSKRLRTMFTEPLRKLSRTIPWPIVFALALLPLVFALNQIFVNDSLPHVPFLYARFGLFLLVLMAALLVPVKHLTKAYWGVLVGAVVAAAVAYISTRAGRPSQIAAMNPIPYGNLCVLLGFLSLLSLRELSSSEQKAGRPRIAAIMTTCIAAAVCGILGSVWTESRGGWLALAVVVSLYICVAPGMQALHKLLALVVFAAILALSYSQITRINTRINLAVDETKSYLNQSNRDTSVGIRLQLWEACLTVIKEHPLSGVGVGHYEQALKSLSERGVISPLAATMPHSHNELAYFSTLMGIPGLVCIICIYFVPAAWFLSRSRSRQGRARNAAYMGLTTCLLFFVFGWTEVMFVIAATNVLYVTLLALFTAIIIRSELQ